MPLEQVMSFTDSWSRSQKCVAYTERDILNTAVDQVSQQYLWLSWLQIVVVAILGQLS